VEIRVGVHLSVVKISFETLLVRDVSLSACSTQAMMCPPLEVAIA
jgi:hypothetical protein